MVKKPSGVNTRIGPWHQQRKAKEGQLSRDFGVYPGLKAGIDPNPGKGARIGCSIGVGCGSGGNVTSVDDKVFSSSHAASSTAGQAEMKPEWKVMFGHS